MGPDFILGADGDMKVTPHDARDSVAFQHADSASIEGKGRLGVQHVLRQPLMLHPC